MKTLALVTIIVSSIVSWNIMSFVAPAHSADTLDAQIQRLREGKEVTITETEFKKIRTVANEKFFTAGAELYIEQVKWSLLFPEGQGGWPHRSSFVSDPDLTVETYRKVKEMAERTGDPLLDYALICPALYVANEPEVAKILIRLEKKDKFLYDKADRNLEFWRHSIADLMRGR